MRGSASPPTASRSTKDPLLTRTRYRIFEEEYPYFLTDTVVAWLPIFAYPAFAEIIFDFWQFLQRERGVQILGYVVMENHIHWIAAAPNLSQHVGRFKSYTARCIIKELGKRGFATILEELRFFKLRHKARQEHQLWQEGSHPEQIRTEVMLLQKLEYMHNNPLRRGYVADPSHWRYSSARNYAGLEAMLEIVKEW